MAGVSRAGVTVPLSINCCICGFRLIFGAEKGDTAIDLYGAFIEMCSQACLEILLRIGVITENTSCVVGSHQSLPLRQKVVLYTASQDRRAEYHATIFQQRSHVLEDDAFAFQNAGQAMQKIVEANGTKTRRADSNGLEHIAHVAGRSGAIV